MSKNKVFATFIFLGVVGMVWFFSYPAFKEMNRKNGIEDEIAELNEQKEKIERDNSLMKERIIYYETAEYKEKVAKDKLNLQKKGEKVAVVKLNHFSNNDNSVENKKGSVISEEGDYNKENYLKWWKYFFR